MFDKRLLKAVPEALRYIAANVIFQCLALVANIVLMVVIGLFLQRMLTKQIASSDLTFLLIIGIAAIVVRIISQMCAQRMSFKSSAIAKRRIRQMVYEKLLRLGPSYSEHISTSEAVQISTEGVEQLEVYFGAYISQFIYALAAPIILFCCLAPFSIVAAVVLLVCVPLIPISVVAVQQIARRVMRNYYGHYTDLGAAFLENVQGLTTLKIYRADEARHELMNHEAESFRQATMRLLRMQLNSITVMDLLAYGAAAAGIVVTLFQFVAGNVSFAGAFTIVFLSADFFLPMRSLGSLFHTAMNGMAAADKMFDLLEAPEAPAGSAQLDRSNCAIRCTNLRYTYDGKRMALDGLDFAADTNGLFAVVGESGSGKSTLGGVLAGRNIGYEGEVRVGPYDLRDITRDSLADSITTVASASWLFKGTIRENLLMGKPDATDAELWDALVRCRLADFVRGEGGLDAPVAEGGSNLSGGQRQRLAIARSLLHDCAIYIFDEATSNIDVESEAAIMEVIHELAQDRIVVAIAHRLAVVKDATCIYVMEGGRVLESGTHKQLIDAGGVYKTMWSKQQELEAFTTVPSSFGAAASTADGPATVTTPTGPTSADPVIAPATPTTAPAQERSAFSILMRLMRLVGPLVPYMILAVALGVLGFAAAIFLTVNGTAGLLSESGVSSIMSLKTAVVLIIICGVTRGFLRYGEQLCNHFIAFKLLALIRDKVFSALRRLAPAKLEGRDKGNLVSIVTSDIELLEVFYAHTISPVLIAFIVSICMTAFIALQSWQLAIIAAVAYIVIGVAVPLVFSRGVSQAGRAMRDQLGDANSFVLESLRGLVEILQYRQGEQRCEAMLSRTDSLSVAEQKLKDRNAISTAVTGALVLAFDLAMITFAYILFAQGELGFGQAVLAIIALMSSFGPVIAVAALGTTLQQTIASGARVLDLLDEKPQCSDITDGRDIAFEGAAVRDVTFSYQEEIILQNVSVSFEPNTVVGISGKSGSGKSTLLKLLMRFWDPNSGEVEMSGVNLRKVNTDSLRANEGYMTQDTHLFDGSIADNIMLARPDASREELEAACAKASLSELIERLPQGLDTQVGELGGALSGGERQRVGLARVFLHDAPLVLLDEPTSNLDALTEASVLKSLSDFREGKTIVLVSHRASTCAFADLSYSVDRGRVS